MVAHTRDRRRLRRSSKKRIDRLRSRRADSGANVLRLMRELLEGHVVRHHLLLLEEGMVGGQAMRNAGGWEVCWLGGGTAEVVAALNRWRLTGAALVGLRSGLLCSLAWWTGSCSRDVQELTVAVEGHRSIWVRRLVLLVMV